MTTREELADSLIARAGWVCPGCVPTLAVALTDEAWTVAVHHAAGCMAVAAWLVHNLGPLPGTGRPST